MILSEDQVGFYRKNGYIVIRDLFTEEELQKVVASGETIVSQGRKGVFFSVVQKGAMHTDETLRSLAVKSKMPQVAAELMELDPQSQNLRILRDVFLVKDVNVDDVCDWHVDDQAFWPESFISTASEESGKDQTGVNAWIALDDMPKEYHGSMALAAGSHTAPWRWEAYEAIGQDHKSHETNLDKILKNIKEKWSTCDGIKDHRPDLREKLEASSEIVDLKRGDVIFASRLLFHRTLAVTPEGKEYFSEKGKECLLRYSVRYVPGSAILPSGFTAEWSIMHNDLNRGRTLDEVAQDKSNACWYPKVWPEMDNLESLGIAEETLSLVKEKERAVYEEFRELMKKRSDNETS